MKDAPTEPETRAKPAKSPNGLLLGGMTLGVLFLCAPFFGAIAALIRLNNHVASVGISDVPGAATGIGNSLSPMALGLFLCPVGLLILIVCILLWRKTGETVTPKD